MNRKILGIIVAFLALAMLTVPVMAKPAEKVTFTAIQIPIPQPPPPGSISVSNGDIVHGKNLPGAGTIKLWIDSAPPATPTYTGTSSALLIYNINLKTGEGPVKFNMTWTFATGTFEGNILGGIADLSGPGMNAFVDCHGVLHGTGEFEGQIIQIAGEKPVGQPFTWTGTIVIPK